MALSHLSLTDFRCFPTLELDLSDQLVIVGANGRGKSSILEAITLLALTRSPRTRSDSELIRADRETAIITGTVGPRKQVRIAVSTERERVIKRASLFGSVVPLTELVGTVQIVSFLPEDLELFTGPPKARRGLVDSLLLQRVGKQYAETLVAFHRALKQRNSLLAQRMPIDALRSTVGVWDSLLVGAATSIINQRIELSRELHETTARILAEMNVPLELELHYHSTVTDLMRFDELLTARLERDRELGSTSIGPHRDDLLLTVNGRPMVSASRGEQRAVLVALKLAEYERLAAGNADSAPIFLVDDVFSELDPVRRDIVAQRLVSRPCIITTADASTIPSTLSSLPRHEL